MAAPKPGTAAGSSVLDGCRPWWQKAPCPFAGRQRLRLRFGNLNAVDLAGQSLALGQKLFVVAHYFSHRRIAIAEIASQQDCLRLRLRCNRLQRHSVVAVEQRCAGFQVEAEIKCFADGETEPTEIGGLDSARAEIDVMTFRDQYRHRLNCLR